MSAFVYFQMAVYLTQKEMAKYLKKLVLMKCACAPTPTSFFPSDRYAAPLLDSGVTASVRTVTRET